MVLPTTWTYQGRWRRMQNMDAAGTGSIHDDEAARKAGFEGGFVPGSTVGTAALMAAFDRFGPSWMEGGWYAFKFVSPVYVHNEVREVGEQQANTEDLDVRVVTREGRLCLSGTVGMGARLPWDPALDGTRGADEVLPQVTIGATFGEHEFVPTVQDALQTVDRATTLEAAGEDSPWYRTASPWGGPVLPPEWLHNIALRMQRPYRTGAQRPQPAQRPRRPGMWSAHWLMLRRPIALDQPYRMTQRVADKGRSGRMLFTTFEFTVQDAAGDEVAVGRHQTKAFAEDE